MITDLMLRLGAEGAAATRAAVTSVGTAANEAAASVAGIGQAGSTASTSLADLAMASTPIGQIAGGLQGIGSGQILSGLAAVGSGVMGIASAAADAANALWGLAQAGSGSNQIEDAFARLGGTAEGMEKLRAATANLVDDTSLQVIANKANQAGIEFGDLIKILERAPGAAVIAGKDTKTAADAMLTSLIKLSGEGFEQLGIKLGETGALYGAYAKKSGLAAASLTDDQKRQAVMEVALERTVAASTQTETARQNAIGQTQTVFANLQSTLEQTAARALTASSALDGIQEVGGMMATVLTEAGQAGAPLIGALGSIATSILSGLMPALKLVGVGLELAAPLIDVVAISVETLSMVVGPLIGGLAELAGMITGPVSTALGWYRDAVGAVHGVLREVGGAIVGAFQPDPVVRVTESIREQIDRVRDLITATREVGVVQEAEAKKRLLTLAQEIEGQTGLRALLELPEIQLKKAATAGQEAVDTIEVLRSAFAESGNAADISTTAVVLLQDAVRKVGKEGQEAADEFGTLAIQQSRGVEELMSGVNDVEDAANRIIAERVVAGERMLSQDELMGEAVMRVAAARGVDKTLLADAVVLGESRLAQMREEFLLAAKTVEASEFQNQKTKDLALLGIMREPPKPRAKSASSGNAEKIIYEASLIGLDEIDKKLADVQRRLSENLRTAGRNAEAVVAAHQIAAAETSTLHAQRMGQISAQLLKEREVANAQAAGWTALSTGGANALALGQRLLEGFGAEVMAQLSRDPIEVAFERISAGVYEAADAINQTMPVWQQFASQMQEELSPSAAAAVEAIGTVESMVMAANTSLQAGQGMAGAALAASKAAAIGFIKDQKAQATIMGMLEIAEAARSAANLNFIGAGLHVAAAAKYFIVAGSRSAPSAPTAPSATAQRQTGEASTRQAATARQVQPINQYFNFGSLDRRPAGIIVADALNSTAQQRRGVRLDSSLVGDPAYIGA